MNILIIKVNYLCISLPYYQLNLLVLSVFSFLIFTFDNFPSSYFQTLAMYDFSLSLLHAFQVDLSSCKLLSVLLLQICGQSSASLFCLPFSVPVLLPSSQDFTLLWPSWMVFCCAVSTVFLPSSYLQLQVLLLKTESFDLRQLYKLYIKTTDPRG